MPHFDFPQSFCRAGFAQRDITPPVGIYHRMWGAATHDRSTGIHRPLIATALALRNTAAEAAANDASATQVLIGIDHCLLWNEEMDDLRSAVCLAAKLEPAQLHIAFTHTHAAGLMDPNRRDLPGGEYIAPYLKLLAERAAEAACEALRSLQAAKIVYGIGRCDLAKNRDFWDESSKQFVCGFNPAGIADDTLLVARVCDQQSRTLGTVVNYACHPTTLAWDNTLVSPDYVGALREVVQTATGAPCLFLQGASGDLGPREGYVGDVAIADRNGRQLGYAALAALETLPSGGTRFEYAGPVVSGATIGTWRHAPLSPEAACEKHRWHCESFNVDVPYRPDLPTRDQTEAELAQWRIKEGAAAKSGDWELARDCRAQVERMTRQLARLRSLPGGPTLPIDVSIWQLGDAIWISLPGEYYQRLQRDLRERFPAKPIVIATVTNGWRPCYLPTRGTYGQGIYQESIALAAAGSLELVVEALARRIAQIQSQ